MSEQMGSGSGSGDSHDYFISILPETISRYIFIFMAPGTIIGNALTVYPDHFILNMNIGAISANQNTQGCTCAKISIFPLWLKKYQNKNKMKP